METVTIVSTNVASQIHGFLNYEVSQALSEACSYEVQGAEYMQFNSRAPWAKRKYGNWDGMRRLYHKGTKTFPTGLLTKVIDVLNRHKVPFDIDSVSSNTVLGTPYKSIHSDWLLRDYQMESVVEILRSRRCMVKVATGGGKTVMAGHIINQANPNIGFFLVHTKDLMRQAYDTFTSMFGADTVGRIGGGYRDSCEDFQFYVATIQTVARALNLDYKDDSFSEESWKDDTELDENYAESLQRLVKEADLVMMDECHRVAAPTATAVVDAFLNAEYRIGFSASPWRDDGADLQLEAIFGRVAVDINASWLIENGWLVRPYIQIEDSLSPMKFPKGTKYPTIYEQYIIQNEERNNLILHHARRLVEKQNRVTMVLVSRINHGNMLAMNLSASLGFEVPFISGKSENDKRFGAIDALRDGSLRCVVASTIADEGLDIKPLSGLILAGGGKSSTRALQRIGRTLRPYPGKKDAMIIDFEDNAKNLYDHHKKRLAIYESEPEFVIL